MRHLLANIVSAFIWKQPLRRKVRAMICYPQVRDYIRFVRDYAKRHNMKRPKIKINVGWIACNLVVSLSDKYVFKFPLKSDGRELAIREKRITDALRPISPIKIPKMEIIPYKDIVVRKYEFAHGALFSDLTPYEVRMHEQHIAKQIAEFLYVIAKANPRELADLKPADKKAPGFLYGWNHGDIWQNFMVDRKTYDITYFIDWESANFGSLYPCLYSANYHWARFNHRGLLVCVVVEYMKLYSESRVK